MFARGPAFWPWVDRGTARLRPGRGAIVAIGSTALLVLWHAWWIVTNRSDGPLNIDEAGYLALASGATADVQAGAIIHGPGALWVSTASGPLLPLVTVIWQLLLGRTISVGLLSNLTFFVVLAASTFGLARHWLPPRWALLVALAALTAPGTTDFTRSYIFALAAAATFTLTVWALLATRRFARKGPSLLFGVAMGATVLARTIMVAFVPALLVAALVAWLQNPPDRRRQPRGNALAAGLAMTVVAGSWYVFSLRPVLRYLLGWGYGAESADYGAFGWQTWRFWLSDAADLLADDLYLPLTVVLATGAVLGGWSWWRSARPHSLRRALASDALLLAIPIAGGMLALLTSRNTVPGSTLPLVPASVVLAGVLASHVGARATRMAIAVSLGLVMLLNVGMKASGIPVLRDQRVAWSNSWTRLPVTDGRSSIARYVATEGGYPLEPDGGVPAVQRSWLGAARATTDRLRALPADEKRPLRVLLTVDGPMYNINDLSLASALDSATPIRIVPFDQTSSRATRSALTSSFTDRREEGVTALITGPDSITWAGHGWGGGQGPLRYRVEAAAAAAGFIPAGHAHLPDGQSVTIWTIGPDNSDQ